MNRLKVYLATGATALVLNGCVTMPPLESQARADLRGNGIENAEKLLHSADEFAENSQNRNIAAVYRLRAAEIAWTDLAKNGNSVKKLTALSPKDQRAVHVLNKATGEIALLLIGGANTSAEQKYSFAGYSYRLGPALVNSRGENKPSDFESAVTADKVPHKFVREWHTEDGVGAPLAPRWRMPTDDAHKRFAPLAGYAESITASLQFTKSTPRSVRVAYLEPEIVTRVQVGSGEYPIAADFTAPMVDRYSKIKESSIALGGLLSSNTKDARLGLLEPYDPHRICVVFVHGLNSHPLMWRDVVNDLRADPELRDKYQFLAFYYPTGWPPAYSALRLREELTAFDKVYGRQHNMVLIGHSMGGIISRLQVISPQRTIWNAQMGQNADELYKKLPPDHLSKRTLLFSANPEIGREIYICVPHRGSKMADWSAVSFFTKFIKMPTAIMTAAAEAPGVITERRQLSSVNRLSPNNPLYPAIDHVPIKVPYHSIIGDRGKGDSPHSSDGVVEYWSSHLDGAKSELIVPGPHGSYSLPQTIVEMKRILKLHLATVQKTASNEEAPVIAEHPNSQISQLPLESKIP